MVHILRRFPHRLDDLVEMDFGLARVAIQSDIGRRDSFDGPHAIALDTGYLHQPLDGVASEAQVVFHGDFCGHQGLVGAAAQPFGKRCCRHGRRHSDFCLAAAHGCGDGRPLLKDAAHLAGNQ